MERNHCSCWKGRSCISEPIRCRSAGGRPEVSARLHLHSLFLLFAGSWSIKSDRSRLNKVKILKKKCLHAAESFTKRENWNPSTLACTQQQARSALRCPLPSRKDITSNTSDNPEFGHGGQTKIWKSVQHYFYFCNQQQDSATGQPSRQWSGIMMSVSILEEKHVQGVFAAAIQLAQRRPVDDSGGSRGAGPRSLARSLLKCLFESTNDVTRGQSSSWRRDKGWAWWGNVAAMIVWDLLNGGVTRRRTAFWIKDGAKSFERGAEPKVRPDNETWERERRWK